MAGFHPLPSALAFSGALLTATLTAAAAEHRWTFADAGLPAVGIVDFIAGPPSRLYPTFKEDARAASFGGKGSYLRIPGSGSDPKLRFTNGDTITIEAWVRCDRIANDQNQYLIGKGRTHREGFDRDNQNWALRLRGEGGQAKLSFLFRSAAAPGQPGDYHRWTSSRGFAPGKRWHHLAVTYTFGDPDSLRAFVDGKRSGGGWDLGLATTRPPVVDDDEVWIGSALGGSVSNSLHGALVEAAVHRGAVPGIEKRYEVRSGAPPLPLASLPPGRVHVEIFPADAGRKEWPMLVDNPIRVLDGTGFALFRLPPHYGSRGQRLELNGTYLLRLTGRISLPAGDHELLLRAPGLAKLTIDENDLALLGPSRITRDAHGPLRPALDTPYPRPRLGTHQTSVGFRSDGQPRIVTVHALVGDIGGKVQVGELLVATRQAGSDSWELLAPKSHLPFDAITMERYRQDEQRHQETLDTRHRRQLADRDAGHWNARHESARTYLASLPPLAIPDSPAASPIDRFLNAKIKAAQARQPDPDSSFLKTVHPLLEEHCFRCHGKKQKGELRLDSREAALKGGESGPAVVPRDLAGSELIRRITSTDEDERMPPKGDPLAAEQVAAFQAWIENGAPWEQPVASVTIPGALDDLSFLRRLYLDTVGVFPAPEDVESYLRDPSPHKTARLIDSLLADPRHADHWVSYWQDVLAENPRLVKPMLNNTGPFRYWLHESLLDNKPLDRFVTELVTFSGGDWGGGAGGFGIATQNDSPMAAKAHILGTAFLGLEMKCARCHDAPYHSFQQEDLFSMAAMLKGSPLKVPATSTVPRAFFDKITDRKPLIEVTLDPATPVAPKWPFAALTGSVPRQPLANSSEELAFQITRPENRRFARVIVNRVWKRYFGQGFVEPAGDWEGAPPSHPALLDFLAREFVSNNYDLRHLSRLILNSAAYRRAPRTEEVASADSRFFEAPLRRRLSAEQILDSLFAATGTPVFSEELTLDVEGWYPDKNFLNMGHPRRAWEFVSLSTERDRPSLVLPRAQAIVSFLEAYGWRSNRSEPLTDRPADPDIRQAGVLANGLLGTWWTRLSDYSALTRLALHSNSPDELIDQLYLRLLTRQPTKSERNALLALLAPGFDSRLARPVDTFAVRTFAHEVREISWRNHLNPEANQFAALLEDRVDDGPPPTDFLTAGWRERMEDAIWAVVNSPEMQFTP